MFTDEPAGQKSRAGQKQAKAALLNSVLNLGKPLFAKLDFLIGPKLELIASVRSEVDSQLAQKLFHQVAIFMGIRNKKPDGRQNLHVLRGALHIGHLALHHALDLFGNAVLSLEPHHALLRISPGLPIRLQRQPYAGRLRRIINLLPELPERG